MHGLLILTLCVGLAGSTIGLAPMASDAAQARPRALAQTTSTDSPPAETPDMTTTAWATPEPTAQITASPTTGPTTQPTLEPTSQLTLEPTQGPTTGPTRGATNQTTAQPTDGTPPRPTPTSGTPVVDPEPGPGRLFLPRVIRGDDASLPPPVVAGAKGWLHALLPRGLEACAPATHVLLEKREGAVDNKAIAVLENRMDDLELDFYIGEHVEVGGLESLSAEACRSMTSRHIGVLTIRRVPQPPGTGR